MDTVIDLETLYARHARDVYRFALYLSGNHAAAEDITSETFARVLSHDGEVRVATVKGYLFTIARNLYRQGLRRETLRSELPETLADRAPGAEREAQAREELAAVMRAMQELTEVDRAALLMRAQHRLPYEEIAAALGISVVAAKVKIHRARVKLAESRGVSS